VSSSVRGSTHHVVLLFDESVTHGVYQAVALLLLPILLRCWQMWHMWYNWDEMTASPAQTTLEQPVFTITEIAAKLRLSDETVRRRIQSGELPAIQIKTGSRVTLRVLGSDLVQWLGVETAQKVFGIGAGLDILEQAFAKLKPADRAALIDLAVASAKAQSPERALTGKTLSREEIAARFPKGRQSVTATE
jgi:excisionase family DNA binding protein